MATGVQTYNGAIGVGPDGSSAETVLEVAEAGGMATGLVATSTIVHATPAAFAAHVAHRSQYEDIASQMAASGVDVLLGGGSDYFRPGSRSDGVDLPGQLTSRGCLYVESESNLPTVSEASTLSCLVGLLATGHLSPMPERGPLLQTMISLALAVVADDPEGFFLMIEGSQIDWAQHANNGDWSVAETLDFDAAVQAALTILSDRPNTLVIVTADHETGGMWADPDPVTGELVFTWTTTSHTGQPVPLYADGSHATSFAGYRENYQFGSLLISLERQANQGG
jgi:alkaline phosphatase